MKGIFDRSELIFGKEGQDEISKQKIIIFGIGGVGSWCAESLIRSGIIDLTIVDSDRVCVTNINRQLMATSKTVGEVKTEALKNRLLDINPNAKITAIQKIYEKDTANDFDLNKYDFIIDAIDSLSNKIHLIKEASKTKATLFSSLGAALKIDPTKIKIDKFWSVKGCPLGSKMRKKMRREKDYPEKDFFCVYGDEVLPNKKSSTSCGSTECLCPKNISGPGDESLANHEWCSSKAVINGSLAHITAIFGFTLAGLVMKEIYGEIG